MLERERERVKIRIFSTFCFFPHSHSHKKCEIPLQGGKEKLKTHQFFRFHVFWFSLDVSSCGNNHKSFAKRKIHFHTFVRLWQNHITLMWIIKCFLMMFRAFIIIFMIERVCCTSEAHMRQEKLLIEMKRVESESGAREVGDCEQKCR